MVGKRYIKALSLILGVCTLTGALSGCSPSGKAGGTAISFEEMAQAQAKYATADEKEADIYKFVSSSVTVDIDKLIKVSAEDANNINVFVSKVNETLKGVDSGVITPEAANSLLLEFTSTPFQWKHVDTAILGMDAATRKFFVDVKYTTIADNKKVIPSSTIVAGDPYEAELKKRRYEEYLSILDVKLKGDEGVLASMVEKYENTWGTIESVRATQREVDLFTRSKEEMGTYGGIGKLTYSGFIDETKFSNPADMTLRFVFEYGMSLGSLKGLEMSGVYLKDYILKGNEKVLESLSTAEVANKAIVEPFVDKLIVSYNRAVEGNNDVGLFSIYDKYGTVDKYYKDLADYTYCKYFGFSYDIIGQKADEYYVVVDATKKSRGKGSNMSLPTYNEKYLFTCVEVGKDKLGVRNVEKLASTLIGEPLSLVQDVAGVSDKMLFTEGSFTDENKGKIQKVLENYGNLQLNGISKGKDFLDVVDTGIAQTSMKAIEKSIEDYTADRKVAWISGYETKSNSYVKVKMRELNLGAKSTECMVTLELVNRNGTWKIINANTALSVDISGTSDVNAKGALYDSEKGIQME